MKHGQSTSINLDKVIEVAKKNPSEAIKMLVFYLKLKDAEKT